MFVSGVALHVRQEHFDAALQSCAALPGVEVHARDQARGRAVVTVEAESLRAEVDLVEQMRTIEGVVGAQMVFHGFDETVHFDPTPIEHIAERLS